MTEWKLFEGAHSTVSTFEFHEHRERAPHLEQGAHRPRLETAAELVRQAVASFNASPITVSDLGCGDGGLLSLLKDDPDITAWGYDFQPANAAGWTERGVTAYALDVFNNMDAAIRFGRVAVATEVLEHLRDPHAAVSWIADNADYLVCSSPANEHAGSHDACHAWAWDLAGYRELLEGNGFVLVEQREVGQFQVCLAVAP